MAFTKDFTTLIRDCGLRSDCESCHFLDGVRCPKHEKPSEAPEVDGVCADWIDAETLRNITGRRQLCTVCNTVKNVSQLIRGACRIHTGELPKRIRPMKYKKYGRKDGDVCPMCNKPGYFNAGKYTCVDCSTKLTVAYLRKRRQYYYSQGLGCDGRVITHPEHSHRKEAVTTV